ncbi:protein kinase domain-containing protein [Streptomyces sp. NBC_01012]|uniref:serine/threonine-protein kinase n=1 Tax=Streptomyces sp. NBC_01012 TaxID=2903717 RepID=UPI0038689882|nr:protein kinase [Streptomyces sp. NBC_01012]
MLDLTGSGAKPLGPDDPVQIGGIPLAGRLGAGGMGRVYLGVHEERYVAVKQVLPAIAGEDQDFVRRFGHELDNLARLPAEATAPLIASDRDARPPWLATAYVPGLTLSEALRLHEGPLPADTLWLLLREAAAGLVAVHELDMVHRDLKPSNVMLTVDGATVIDFGVARATEQSQLTMSGMVVGTPAYMAPEQATMQRDLTGAADVFALASVIAYAASGSPPFGEESGHAVLYRIVHEAPDLDVVRELDPGLADVLAECLAKDPGARPTAAELLRRAEDHGPFTAPLWPESISGSLAEKAAFAADVQEIELPPPVSVETRDLGLKARPKFRERRRRTRVTLVAVPLVVAVGGATLAVQLLPGVLGPGDDAAAGPAVSGTASAAPTAPGSDADTSSSASPSSSSKDKEKKKEEDGEDDGKDEGKDGGSAPAPGSGDSGGDAQGGSGGSSGAGNGGGSSSEGSGASDGPSGSGGSKGSGASDGGSDGGSTTPSGTHRYRNGNNNKCLIAVYGSSDAGDCSDPSATWTVRTVSGGSFELVNKQTGRCLSANMIGQAVFTEACDEAGARRWRAGSKGSIVSVSNGGCLDLGLGSGIAANTCGGEASQRWTAL